MKLEVTNLVQGYGKKTILKGINFSAESGKILTVLGPNGSGKSTLIKTICNVMGKKGGSITIDDKEITDYDRKDLAKKIAYVPQKNVFFGYSNVYDAVLIGRKPYVKWSYSKEDLTKAADAMIAMKVDDLYDRHVQELSGGQMQRVTLARALAQNPELYVFDEPTSALDLRNQLDTLELMKNVITRDNSSMIIALHDLNLALRYSDEVLVLKDGIVYDFGSSEKVITEKMILDVYGVLSEIVEGRKGLYVHALSSDSE
ncbi:MAG: ABC transporter ATP-binding protein [Candidatus Methanomethylophilaceae archaeon]|nr:ABC transporter ATP-binding protein [Candidatus Methanomethylophilaceae archaeon]